MDDLPKAPPAPLPNWAYFLDFDGTLVDIAEHPEAVSVRPELVDLLRLLDAATSGALVLVSGRSIRTLDRFLAPLQLRAAGLHGLEYRQESDGAVQRSRCLDQALDLVRPQLQAFTAGQAAVRLEDKESSIALHYRRAPERQEAVRLAAVEACRALGSDFTCLAGKMVYEIKPRDAHKGQVLERFMARPPFQGRKPVFVGDDVTDEDGFRVCNELGGLSVRVGAADAVTEARYNLADVTAVMTWLGSLVKDVVGLAR
jgi:trehalose 6-phosphate phosphatase